MFFLFILVIFTILIIAIHTSKIGIDIKNLIIDTDAEEKINEDGKIYVYLLLFNKIKLFRKNVRNIPMKDVKFETSDFDIKIFKNKDIKINYLELIQNINIDINMLKYNIILVAITFLLSTFIGFLFKYAPIMYNVINHNICEKCLFTLKIVGIILSITTSININLIVSTFSNVFNNLFIYGEKIYSIM